jgi:hypothetical protein
VVCNLKGWVVVVYLVNYWVDDIDMLSGRSDYQLYNIMLKHAHGSER